MIPAALGVPTAFLYLTTQDYTYRRRATDTADTILHCSVSADAHPRMTMPWINPWRLLRCYPNRPNFISYVVNPSVICGRQKWVGLSVETWRIS
jgi:hypothetical protein